MLEYFGVVMELEVMSLSKSDASEALRVGASPTYAT